MQDMRKLKRRHLIYYLRVFDLQTGELLGHVADLTREGLMLVSEKAIETDKDFILNMQLPREILESENLEFPAHSIWCKPDINPRFFTTGFGLGQIPGRTIRIIEHLIEDFGFRD